jgi:protein tyrosine phosphatase (PTP) superfamily phosphohydrolase (DUF442 family)
LADPEDIRGWQRLSARVTTSGKLDPGDPARLAGIGVKHVVNLALDDHPEALADEGDQMAQAGIGYSHIPVPFDAPDYAHFARFCEALAGEEPVHVHCIMNWRVSAFFYRLHRAQGMAEAEARALMQQQWDPDTTEHPAAKAWSAFIAAG